MSDVVNSSGSNTSAPAPVSARHAVRRLAAIIFEQGWVVLLAMAAGLALAWLYTNKTPTTYAAQGQFLVGDLPILSGSAQQVDPETSRQLVQSLILSIPSAELKRVVARELNVVETNLAFADRDKPLKLAGEEGKRQANIHVAAVRNTRLGSVTATSADRQFAMNVVNAMLQQLSVINAVAGQINDIDNRLRMAQGTVELLNRELVQAAADRIRLEKQEDELNEYTRRQMDLAAFPAFENDATLNNLKTQLILVSAEYENLTRTATQGPRLEGKKAEVENLRRQIAAHSRRLVEASHVSLAISRTRESTLQARLREQGSEQKALAEQRATLVKALTDAAMRTDLARSTNQPLSTAGAVIAVVDPARSEPKPVKPRGLVNYAMGAMLGLGIGAGFLLLRFLFDDRIRDAQQIEQAELPLLSASPGRGQKQSEWLASHFIRDQLLGKQHAFVAFIGVGRRVPSQRIVADVARDLASANKSVLVVDLGDNPSRLSAELGVAKGENLPSWETQRSLDTAPVSVPQSGMKLLRVSANGHPSREVLLRHPLVQELRGNQSRYDCVLFHGSEAQIPALLLAAPEETLVVGVARKRRTRVEQLVSFADVSQRERLRDVRVLLVK